MTAQADTFARSCEHWSDAGRDEMEAFYELARIDYRHLAEAYDWKGAFQTIADRAPVDGIPVKHERVGKRDALHLADIACGSGKFPQALLSYADLGGLAAGAGLTIDYDLLDPSEFSLREARQALAAPFEPGAEFCCTLQDWQAASGHYDITWATHALYCVPAKELEPALARMCGALAQEGFGFVAQGMRDGHYVGFYDQYLASLTDGQATPYSDGVQVADALKKLGMCVQTRVIEYTTVVPAARTELLESYLQRCAFDDTHSLDEMRTHEPLATYLATCCDPDSGDYRFPQRVAMILFAHSEAGLVLRDAKASEAA